MGEDFVNETDLEDYKTVEVREENGESAEDYPNFSIKIERAQYSVYEMKRQYDRGRICIDPEFQRNDVWSIRQKSELIESVIMGIPLPLIYLAENADGQLIVVDGRQRLSTFFAFLNNEFKLRDLKILSHINGMNLKAIDNDKRYARYVSIIEDTQLVVQIIKYPTKDRVRFDIFDRVNRGGTPLNKQEMRNALYQGNATKLLNKLAEMKSFKSATGNAISSKHMKDKYIILRALCFYLWINNELKSPEGKEIDYRSDMEDFLGSGIQFFNSMEKVELERIEKIFDTAMVRAYTCMGADGFRIPSSGAKRPISMTLFESLFYYYTLFDEVVDDRVIVEGVNELLEDSKFLWSLQHSVDSSANVYIRFQKVIDKYEEIVNAE